MALVIEGNVEIMAFPGLQHDVGFSVSWLVSSAALLGNARPTIWGWRDPECKRTAVGFRNRRVVNERNGQRGDPPAYGTRVSGLW